jgi:hypothetical protein
MLGQTNKYGGLSRHASTISRSQQSQPKCEVPMKFPHLIKHFLLYPVLLASLGGSLILAHGCLAATNKSTPEQQGTPLSALKDLGTSPLPAQLDYAYSWARSSDSKSEEVHQTLSQDQILALLKALAAASWSPADKPASVIEHTDDYPSYTLSFKLSSNHSVKLFSTSNTQLNLPWNLQIDDQLYTSSSQAVGQAMSDLFAKLRPQN